VTKSLEFSGTISLLCQLTNPLFHCREQGEGQREAEPLSGTSSTSPGIALPCCQRPLPCKVLHLKARMLSLFFSLFLLFRPLKPMKRGGKKK